MTKAPSQLQPQGNGYQQYSNKSENRDSMEMNQYRTRYDDLEKEAQNVDLIAEQQEKILGERHPLRDADDVKPSQKPVRKRNYILGRDYFQIDSNTKKY